jgi:hypothetical protein
MNAAATHLESNVANGEETREFLSQSVGFENELIGQTNFPHQPSCEVPSRVANFFLFGQALPDVLETVPDLPPPAGICRQRQGLGKAESSARLGARAGSKSAISRMVLPRFTGRFRTPKGAPESGR